LIDLGKSGNTSLIFIALFFGTNKQTEVRILLSNISKALGLIGCYDNEHAFRLIAFTTSLRIAYLFIFPLGLVGDESYYWEWGRNLDWGYYSKPPFIGWLMGIISWAGANSAPWLRVPAALLGGGILFAFHRLGQYLFTPKIAFWSTVFLLLTPALSAVSLIISIDAPLLFFWTLSMLAFWVVFYEKSNWGWILILILSLGLGNLTKQMMLIFPALGALTLLQDSSKRYLLKKPWIWLGWLSTLAFLIPSLWWNYSNDWITLKHTASHINQNNFNFSERLASFAEFMVSESFIIGPILFLGGLVSLYKILKSKTNDSRIRFLLIFSLPPISVFIALSFTQKVNPNWPAVFYLPMILLCTFYFIKESTDNNKTGQNRFILINLTVSLVLSAILYLSVFAIDVLNLNGSKYDLFKRLRGYKDYATQVIEIKNSLSQGEDLEIIVIGHRYDLCQLAFAGPGQPKVHGFWDKQQNINSQYDLWSAQKELGEKDALIIQNTSNKIPVRLYDKFEKITLLNQKIRIPFPVGKQLFFDLHHAKAKRENL